jgi:hypothetical protein
MSGAISDFDATHIGAILSGHGTWFSAEVLRLCAKADRGNLERIRRAFPDHVAAFEAWRDSPYGDEDDAA